ncbi:MAG: hypothetical protein U0183_10985 [Polyangiaceae bacterium]
MKATWVAAALVAFIMSACKTTDPDAARRETPAPPASSQVQAARAPSLTRVDDRSTVCMVTNRFMGRAQIAVPVAGKTYFGCCEMCKARLGQEPALREAEDPYSHRQVDKAGAIIARDAEGNVFYFESKANLSAALARSAP